MSADVVVILQARLVSSRLPGKALAPIGGKTLLAHCIQRLTWARVGPVIVATTRGSEDDAIVSEATREGASVARGATDDVLGRFLLAIQGRTETLVIRATADNPAVDPDGASRVLAVLRDGADYAVETDLPVGAAVEAVRATALRDAGAAATTLYDREHVTPLIRRHPERFRVVEAPAPPALRRPDLRFTVDTAADLAYMRRLMEPLLGRPSPTPLAELIDRASVATHHEQS